MPQRVRLGACPVPSPVEAERHLGHQGSDERVVGRAVAGRRGGLEVQMTGPVPPARGRLEHLLAQGFRCGTNPACAVKTGRCWPARPCAWDQPACSGRRVRTDRRPVPTTDQSRLRGNDSLSLAVSRFPPGPARVRGDDQLNFDPQYRSLGPAPPARGRHCLTWLSSDHTGEFRSLWLPSRLTETLDQVDRVA